MRRHAAVGQGGRQMKQAFSIEIAVVIFMIAALVQCVGP